MLKSMSLWTGMANTADLTLQLSHPPHRGSKLIENSGVGDNMGWVQVDAFTLNPVEGVTLRHKDRLLRVA